MKKSFQISIMFVVIFFAFTSCTNSNDSESSKKLSSNHDQSPEPKALELSVDFLGIYKGAQPSHFMKNQYDDDVIIAGNKIPIPSSDFKFLLKESNIVSLQQTNLEDNSRVYYEGSIKIIDDATDFIKIKCLLSDNNSSSPSNPTYILVINKFDKSTTCIPENRLNGPEFKLEKIDLNSIGDLQGISNKPANAMQKNSANNQNFQPGFYFTNASENHKVYFYNMPNSSVRRNAYINTQEEIFVQKIVNGFGYVEFINSRGQRSIGWLDIRDLVQKP